jgi:hypothetical protein
VTAEIMTRACPSVAGTLLQKAVHWLTNLSPDFGNTSALSPSLLCRYGA